MMVFDHITKTIAVVAHAQIGAASNQDLRAIYEATCARVDALVARLQAPVSTLSLKDIDVTAQGDSRKGPLGRYQSNFTPKGFEDAVRRAIEYINAGDIFQVVLSQRFSTETQAKPFDVYRALRVLNPSPFMFYVASGPVTLVGASPEILCRVDSGEVTIRPLAGTRRRGTTPEEDRHLAEELLADPKERAEHIMLVDLGRNDVGKVSQLGSVQISDLLTVERYSHVMHLSSTVTGTLQQGLTAFDAMRSALPAGTLSGAPKVRAMEIIDELEPERRGVYAGAVGYLGFNGNLDLAIAIRTGVVKDGELHVQAAAGIVADSIPEQEWLETRNKARALLAAAELTNAGLDAPVA
jgi:anthranilate synthase component 1